MTRSALTRRVEALEGRRVEALDLSNLTDEELHQWGAELIEQMARAGLKLPDDWRQQYDAEPMRFMDWAQREAEQ